MCFYILYVPNCYLTLQHSWRFLEKSVLSFPSSMMRAESFVNLIWHEVVNPQLFFSRWRKWEQIFVYFKTFVLDKVRKDLNIRMLCNWTIPIFCISKISASLMALECWKLIPLNEPIDWEFLKSHPNISGRNIKLVPLLSLNFNVNSKLSADLKLFAYTKIFPLFDWTKEWNFSFLIFGYLQFHCQTKVGESKWWHLLENLIKKNKHNVNVFDYIIEKSQLHTCKS